MDTEDYAEDYPDEDKAIESVLGDNPRADHLAELITALASRKRAVLREAEKTISANERIRLEAKLAEMAMQLKALREEQAITTFVENSVRVTINKPSMLDLEED